MWHIARDVFKMFLAEESVNVRGKDAANYLAVL